MRGVGRCLNHPETPQELLWTKTWYDDQWRTGESSQREKSLPESATKETKMRGTQSFIGCVSNLTPLSLNTSNSEFENYFPFGKNSSNFLTETTGKQISLWKNIWLKSNTVQNALHVILSIHLTLTSTGWVLLLLFSMWDNEIQRLIHCPMLQVKKLVSVWPF